MLDKNVIPTEILQEIEEDINTELAKRCYPKVKITLGKSRDGDVRFNIKSEPFNTIPALMKSIVLNDWSTSTALRTEKIVRVNSGKDVNVKVESVYIYISVHASYEHWNGGSNSCKVFEYRAQMWENSYGEISLGRETIS